jgi:hypothetical protein
MAFHPLVNLTCSHRVFLDASEDQDPGNLKGAVTVSRHADFRSWQINNVGERPGGGVLLTALTASKSACVSPESRATKRPTWVWASQIMLVPTSKPAA